VRSLALAALLVAPALAGCTLVSAPQPEDVSGPVDGYDPTTSLLKVHVHEGDRVVLVDFDRRDWNAAGIAQLIDNLTVRNLTIHGMPRDILDEVLVQSVGSPSVLERYRWTDQTTPEERSAADQAYDALVAKAHPITAAAPPTPTFALPTVPAP
jgi:hypothetical protein